MNISVIVATRDRPGLCRACLVSLLANDYAHREIIVVDQSCGDETEEVVGALTPGVHGLRYVRSATAGSSRARNQGIALSQGDVLAFTDDDCLAATDWLAAIAAEFGADEKLMAVYGRILPLFTRDGVVPIAFKESPRREEYGGRAYPWCPGYGANMALRSEAIAKIGHFDESLGPAARFGSCNDVDLTYRLLVSGARVVYSPQVLVYHQQWRSLRRVMARERDYALGTGAFLVKHLRCGDFYVGRMLFDRLWTYGLLLALTRVREEAGRVSRQQALLYFLYKAYCGLIYTALGAWWGLRWPLSRCPRLYLMDFDK